MNPSSRLRERCHRGLERLVAGRPDLRVDASLRVEQELTELDRLGWSPAMAAAADLADRARDQGIGVGPGRGAVTGSLVAFLAGVTDVNPLDHGLLFERFIATCSRPGTCITLEIESCGYPSIRKRLGGRESAAAGRVRILPSDALGALFRAAKRAFPSRHAEEVFGTMSLGDAEVLRRIDQGPAGGFLTSPSPGGREPRCGGIPVRSFGDVITRMRLVHFPADAAVLSQVIDSARTPSGDPEQSLPVADLVADTFGMFLFEEQAMQAMNRMAGTPLPDAFDLLRRMRADPEPARRAFFSGCTGRGYDSTDTARVWTLLARPTARACKAHLAGLAMINYRWAFLQVHYPEASRDEASPAGRAPKEAT